MPAKPAVALASRQWSCSELQEGLGNVIADVAVDKELAEIEAILGCNINSRK